MGPQDSSLNPPSESKKAYVRPTTCEGCGAKPIPGKVFRRAQRYYDKRGQPVPFKNVGTLKLVYIDDPDHPGKKIPCYLCRQCRKVDQ